jgi:hypothetical protein
MIQKNMLLYQPARSGATPPSSFAVPTASPGDARMAELQPTQRRQRQQAQMWPFIENSRIQMEPPHVIKSDDTFCSKLQLGDIIPLKGEYRLDLTVQKLLQFKTSTKV